MNVSRLAAGSAWSHVRGTWGLVDTHKVYGRVLCIPVSLLGTRVTYALGGGGSNPPAPHLYRINHVRYDSV